LELQGNLTTVDDVNVNPGSTLLVDPPGSVNAGGDVNLNNSTAVVQGGLDAGGSININPGSGFLGRASAIAPSTPRETPSLRARA
jgi:hypothetical protein